jgi:glyceraldehyde 3-phosphate dehydrogenase
MDQVVTLLTEYLDYMPPELKEEQIITPAAINAAMKAASNESFGYTEDQIVSSDIIGMKFGSLFDATQTMVSKVDDDLYQVQVVSWYDNENSYTSQMVRTIKYLAELK